MGLSGYGMQCVADPILCERPDWIDMRAQSAIVCERFARLRDAMRARPHATAVRSGSDRSYPPPHTSGPGSYRLSILFGRRCHRARETRLSPCVHSQTRMLLVPGRTVHTSSRPRPHTFVFAVRTFARFLRQTQRPSRSGCSFGTWAGSGPGSAVVWFLESESVASAWYTREFVSGVTFRLVVCPRTTSSADGGGPLKVGGVSRT